MRKSIPSDLKFRGEIIVWRRDNLDFTKELADISKSIFIKLPKHSRHETIAHYNKKLDKVWKLMELK